LPIVDKLIVKNNAKAPFSMIVIIVTVVVDFVIVMNVIIVIQK